MQLKIYRSLWGMTGPLEEQFSRIAAAGYDGVEAPPQDITDPKHFKALLAQHNLDFMALVYTEGKDHAAHFEQVIDNVVCEASSLFRKIAQDRGAYRDSDCA
jgi:sugar phosphate isomerase/epimerase